MYIKYIICVDSCHHHMFIWCIYIYTHTCYITNIRFFWYGDVTCINNSTHLLGLQDFRTLSDLGIEHGSSLVLVCSNKDTRLVQTNMFVRWKFKSDIYLIIFAKKKQTVFLFFLACWCFLGLCKLELILELSWFSTKRWSREGKPHSRFPVWLQYGLLSTRVQDRAIV